MIVICWVTVSVAAAESTPRGSSPSASSVLYDDRQISPSNSSSEVRRQYELRSLRTVNTWTSGCWSSFVCSDTIGLRTTRVGSSRLRSRQATMASASAPGRRGPATAPATTATAMMPTPVPSSDNRPWRWVPPDHRACRTWPAVRCSSTNTRAHTENRAALATGLPGPPSAAANTNSTVAGQQGLERGRHPERRPVGQERQHPDHRRGGDHETVLDRGGRLDVAEQRPGRPDVVADRPQRVGGGQAPQRRLGEAGPGDHEGADGERDEGGRRDADPRPPQQRDDQVGQQRLQRRAPRGSCRRRTGGACRRRPPP